MMFYLIDPDNCCHLILPLHHCLDSSECDKDPRTFLPKRLHQCAIIKLGNLPRMDVMFVQPLVNAGAWLITAAGQQQRCTIEAVGEITYQLLFQFLCGKEADGALAELVTKARNSADACS